MVVGLLVLRRGQSFSQDCNPSPEQGRPASAGAGRLSGRRSTPKMGADDAPAESGRPLLRSKGSATMATATQPRRTTRRNVQTKLLIDGQWRDSASGKTFETVNP